MGYSVDPNYCDVNGKFMVGNRFAVYLDPQYRQVSELIDQSGNIIPSFSQNYYPVRSIFIPRPGKAHQVFLFSINRIRPDSVRPNTLENHLIDFKLRNGFGDIIPDSTQRIFSSSGDFFPFDLIQHSNGIDYWLIAQKDTTLELYSFLVTKNGIGSSQIAHPSLGQQVSEMESSPNGKLFFVMYGFGEYFGQFHLFDFNANTGIFSNQRKIPTPARSSSFDAVANTFSPDSKLLYTFRLNYFRENNTYRSQIFQYKVDLTDSAAISNSQRLIYDDQSNSLFYSARTGLDGKMYISSFNRTIERDQLSIIHCPNTYGPVCRFQFGWKSFGNTIPISRVSIPIQLQAYFSKVGILQAFADQDTICRGDSVTLSALGAGADRFEWRRNNEPNIFSTRGNIRIAPSQNTTYRLRGIGECTAALDTFVTIYVRPAPIASISRPNSPRRDTLFVCTGDSVRLFSGQASQAGFSVQWWNGAQTPFATFYSDSLPLGRYKVYVTTSNRYCSRSDTIWVRLLPRPLPPQITLSPAADTLGFCPGQTVQLSASAGFSAYAWSNGSTGSQTSFSVPLLPGYAGGVYPFAVQGMASGCQSPTSDTLWLRFRPSPQVPTIQTNPVAGADGVVKVCSGDSIALSGVNPYFPQPVRWRWSSGDTVQNIMIQPNGLSTLRLHLLYPAVNGCLSPADSVLLGNHPVPVVSGFEGPLSVCPGVQQVPYHALGTFLDSVFWQSGIGVLSASGWQSAGTSVLVNFPVLQTDSAWLQVLPQSVFGCLGDTFRAYIRINTRLRPALPLGDSMVCTFNLNQTYRGFLSPGSSYQWTVAGGQIVGNGNELQVQVQWPGPGLGFVRYRETVTIGDSVCEGESTPLRVAIARSPDSTLQIAGPAALCMRSEGVFSLPGFAGSSYQWTLPGGSLSAMPDSSIRLFYAQAGQFPITVVETSDSGCAGRPISTQVQVNPLPLPIPGPNRELCSGESVQLGTANAPLLRYLWEPANFLSNDTLQNPVFRMTYSGSIDTLIRYRLTATDFVNGCSDTASVNIRVKPQPPSPARSDTALCARGSIAMGKLQTGPYLYQWSPVAGLDFPQDPNPTFILPALMVERDSLLQKTVQVRNVISGCSISDTVNIGLWAFPTMAFAQVPDAFCAGREATISLNPPRPDLNLLWQLEPGGVVQTSQNFSYRFDNLDASSKTFQLNLQVSNAKGCQTNAAQLELQVKPYPITDLSPLSPFVCPEQESGYVYALPGPSVYRFEPTNGQVTQSSDTSATITWLLNPGPWQLIVTETRPDGCTSLPQTLNLQLDNQLQHCDINNYLPFIPNVVTPNADGKNDNWQVGNLQYYPQNSLSVFDRWGKKVFEASPYQNSWGSNAKPGTYFYQFNDGRTGKVWKGWVEVISR